MAAHHPLSIPLAVRAYPEPSRKEISKAHKKWVRPEYILVFDTETTTDATQKLLFGSYRFFASGECVEEGLFYADDLPKGDLAILHKYVNSHSADTAGITNLKLISRSGISKETLQRHIQSAMSPSRL